MAVYRAASDFHNIAVNPAFVAETADNPAGACQADSSAGNEHGVVIDIGVVVNSTAGDFPFNGSAAYADPVVIGIAIVAVAAGNVSRPVGKADNCRIGNVYLIGMGVASSTGIAAVNFLINGAAADSYLVLVNIAVTIARPAVNIAAVPRCPLPASRVRMARPPFISTSFA